MKLLTRPRKVAIGVGAGLALAGVAFAAVLLSADISGSTNVTDVNSSLRVQGVRVTDASSGTSCGGSASSDSTVSLNATVQRVNGKIVAQSCTFAIYVQNQGAVPVTGAKIDIDSSQASLKGWTATSQVDSTIPAGSSSSATVTLKAGGVGVTDVGRGAFSGKLTANAE